jgi:hypothetical protein
VVAAAAAGHCPSLAALPVSCQPDEPFALTRLISSQDKDNAVLIAQEGDTLVRSTTASDPGRQEPTCLLSSIAGVLLSVK